MSTALAIGRTAAAGIDRRLLVGFSVSILAHGLMLGSLMSSGRNVATSGRHAAPREVAAQLMALAPAPPPAKRALAPKSVVMASHSNETVALRDDSARSDLHYRTFYDDNPTHPMRCMVGPVAEASGDHEGAIYIFSDCAKNGDNFSAISLAHYYELGLGGAGKDPAKAAELFRRVATSQREAYRTNGMLYYGLCLYFGFGVPEDRAAGRDWLTRAAAGGDPDAARFLALEADGETPSAEQYFKR